MENIQNNLTSYFSSSKYLPPLPYFVRFCLTPPPPWPPPPLLKLDIIYGRSLSDNSSSFFSDMLKISDQGQVFLNYVIGRSKFYMDVGASGKMGNRALKEISDVDCFISKLKEDSYYQGIVFWILKFFQQLSFSAYTNICDAHSYSEPLKVVGSIFPK